MYGAILGDIIGSRFEFDRGDKTKDFDLFGPGCEYTDDTVMTVAVAEALMKAGKDASVEDIEKTVTASMQEWGHRYPNAGYGGRFMGWLAAGKDAKPYGSYGNGSAMRVSVAGWLYDTPERTREVARATANVSHDHPEGIKGAESTASVVYLARTGASKNEIKEYVIKEFGYDLSRTCDDIRPGYYHVEDCQRTVPEAITAFMEGESYEDVIRNAISLGGDTDTLGAIAGAMAEAFYGVPDELKVKANKYLTEEILSIIDEFNFCNVNGLITLEKYTEEIRRKFTVGAKPINEVEAYFLEEETIKTIEDSYKFYARGEEWMGVSPSAVANCLELLY